MKKEPLTQDEVNRIYSKPLISSEEMSRLLGITRQGVRDLLLVRKLVPTELIRGTYYVKPDDFLAYSIGARRKLLEKAGKINLPDNY